MDGVKMAVVTSGENGAVWTDGKSEGKIAGYKVKAFDSTGAGDVFHGGFIHGLLQGWDIEASLRFANAAAALSCLKLSGRLSIPTLKEVQDFLIEKESISRSVRS